MKREKEKKTHNQNLDIDCIKKEFFKLSFHSIAHTILLLFYRGKNLLHKCGARVHVPYMMLSQRISEWLELVPFFLMVYVNVNVAQNYVIIITIATLFSFRVWVNMSLSTHKTDERKSEIGKKKCWEEDRDELDTRNRNRSKQLLQIYKFYERKKENKRHLAPFQRYQNTCLLHNTCLKR